MNILFLRGFNNYFNRVIKKYSTLDDYQSNSTSYVNFESINFNPNDGIVTELVLGNESQKENSLPLDWENIGTPDYCVCYDMVGSNPEIRSRWYVLESERLRSGQYRLALKRDVVAEHFDTIKNSPCFIEKGMVNNPENSLLYNKESMTYNQIKTGEYTLRDGTECGWIVGYVAKNEPSSTVVEQTPNISTTILLEGEPADYIDSADLPFTVGTSTHYAYNTDEMEIEFSQYSSYADTAYATTYWGILSTINSYVLKSDNSISRSKQQCYFSYGSVGTDSPYPVANVPAKLLEKGYWYANQYKKNMTHMYAACSSSGQQPPSLYGFCSGSVPTYMNRNTNSIASIATTLRTHAKTACTTPFSQWGPIVDNVPSYNGKYVKYNNKFYKLNISKVSYRSGVFKVDASSNWSASATSTTIDGLTQYASQINNTKHLSTLRTDISNLISTGFTSSTSSYVARGSTFDLCAISLPRYSIKLELISTETLTVANRVYTNRNHTYDNSADLFAIPYGEIKFANDGTEFTCTRTRSLGMARAIAAVFSSSCYDLQLVPYCPSRELSDNLEWYISGGEAFELTSLDSKTYQIFTSEGADAGVVFWPSSSKGTFDITKMFPSDAEQPIDINVNLIPNVGQGSSALVHKLTNETEVCRIASPNYSGQFEFSIAKNNGVTKFNVDYTYKPYAPYIHVNPDFKFIYGRDWDDARGLICGGDFSLNHITSYWQDYMNNNKNFQQIFDRQIQNMDVNNAIALEKQEFQATVGTITSAIGGAMGGAAAGASAGGLAGPWGALIGGVVGAVGGGVGSGLASAYGAEKDRDWLTRQQQEARSYAIDMYGYQLGNIQAMPYSIKGTDALTNNNKIWPIVEIYDATDLEVQLLTSKIQYNGMTIMSVGNIQDYCTSEDFDRVFIKGQLIRLESDEINDDFHIADAIYQEINKGVYIPSGGL